MTKVLIIDDGERTKLLIRALENERAQRITRLIEEKFMTPEAAAIVVDAAMFGVGCIEGTVRAEQQKRIDRGLPAHIPSKHEPNT